MYCIKEAYYQVLCYPFFSVNHVETLAVLLYLYLNILNMKSQNSTLITDLNCRNFIRLPAHNNINIILFRFNNNLKLLFWWSCDWEGKHWSTVKHSGALWNTVELCETHWSSVKHSGVLWNTGEFCETHFSLVNTVELKHLFCHRTLSVI